MLKSEVFQIKLCLANKNCHFRIMTEERTKRITNVFNKRQQGLGIVLENVSDPHNISAVMRTADAVGVQDIYILNTVISPHLKWGTKSSSSAAKWLSIHQFTDIDSCIRVLRERFDKIYTTHLSDDAQNIYDMDLTENIALVFGNEHGGISKEFLAESDGNFLIPQVGIIKSLNISVACAVCLYEAYRQKERAGHYITKNYIGAKADQLKKDWGID